MHVTIGFILKGIERLTSRFLPWHLALVVSSSKELKENGDAELYLFPITVGFILKGIERIGYSTCRSPKEPVSSSKELKVPCCIYPMYYSRWVSSSKELKDRLEQKGIIEIKKFHPQRN